MDKLCVFAGTAEGRRLLERLAGRGAALVACVATEYGGELLEGLEGVRVCAGRMDAEEMAAFFRREGFAMVVDATHPYAEVVTQNIRAACAATGTPCRRLLRASAAGEGDGIRALDARACVAYLRQTRGNVFLTTGSKDLALFCADEVLRARLYARVLPLRQSLDICAECGLAPERIVAMQGPFDAALNAAMFRAANARYVVTKDTGDAGGYAAKLAAAREVGAQVVVIGRPPQAEGDDLEAVTEEVEKALALAPPRKRVWLVGVGMGDADSRTVGAERALAAAECLIGAGRLLDAVEADDRPRHEAVRADDIAGIIRGDSEHRRFAVLLSGDTGFYSGARKLLAALEDMDVEALPGVSSLSYFCAKLGRPWEDVRPVSLHGRDCDLVRHVRESAAVFALLGGPDGARNALARLCDAGLGRLTVHVGERLDYADERVTSGSATELRDRPFDPLSVLLIENPCAGEAVVTPGLDDDAFERGEVPMTKSEVRSVCLSKLRLTRGAVAYDVGSGTGSVSVEMALLAREGRVYAVEERPEALALTRANAERFGLANLGIVPGRAPEALDGLPAPTHAFIGGSTGGMRAIVDALLAKNPGVRIVATAVTLETAAELTAISGQFSSRDIVQVGVSRAREAGRHSLMTAQNPVFIFAFQNVLK